MKITRTMAGHVSPLRFARYWRWWFWAYRSAQGGWVIITLGHWWHIQCGRQKETQGDTHAD